MELAQHKTPATGVVSTTTKRLLTVPEAAAYLGLSKLTIYEWVSQRKIEYVKVGRLVKFDQRQLERWIEKHTVKVLNPAA
jgi:excisionase family DNA binding protein